MYLADVMCVGTSSSSGLFKIHLRPIHQQHPPVWTGWARVKPPSHLISTTRLSARVIAKIKAPHGCVHEVFHSRLNLARESHKTAYLDVDSAALTGLFSVLGSSVLQLDGAQVG